MAVNRDLRRRQFTLSAFLAGSLVTGCASEDVYENIAADRLNGKSMEEVIDREGPPSRRSETQLVYQYDTGQKITPIWSYLLLYGFSGGGAGPDPDLTYIDRNYFCLVLEFENGVLVRHSKIPRERNDNCQVLDQARLRQSPFFGLRGDE